MKFPTLVYKSPGPHGHKPGYRYTQCPDADALDNLLAGGWHVSKADALAGKKAAPAPAPVVDVAPIDMGAPTRAEMEQKADELGIKIDRRWSDKRLADTIAGAID